MAQLRTHSIDSQYRGTYRCERHTSSCQSIQSQAFPTFPQWRRSICKCDILSQINVASSSTAMISSRFLTPDLQVGLALVSTTVGSHSQRLRRKVRDLLLSNGGALVYRTGHVCTGRDCKSAVDNLAHLCSSSQAHRFQKARTTVLTRDIPADEHA